MCFDVAGIPTFQRIVGYDSSLSTGASRTSLAIAEAIAISSFLLPAQTAVFLRYQKVNHLSIDKVSAVEQSSIVVPC